MLDCSAKLRGHARQNLIRSQGLLKTWLGFFLHDVLCGNQNGGPRQRISSWKRRTEKRKGLQRQVFKGKYCYIVFIFRSLRYSIQN